MIARPPRSERDDRERAPGARRVVPDRGATKEAAERRPPTRAQREARARREARDVRHSAQRRVFRIRAATLLAVVAAIVAGGVTLYGSSLFSISKVEVLGAVNVSSAHVRELAQVPPDATLIRFPADAVASRVAADPWVRSVTVSRVFPDGMRIRVVERAPVAMVDGGVALWLIDSVGMVMARRSAEQTVTSIVIRDVTGLDMKVGRVTTSEPLLNALAVLSGLSRSLADEVRSISAPSIDGTTLYTRAKVEVVFGDARDAKVKDELVRRILTEQAGKVVSIDVRTIDRPTWRGLPK